MDSFSLVYSKIILKFVKTNQSRKMADHIIRFLTFLVKVLNSLKRMDYNKSNRPLK